MTDTSPTLVKATFVGNYRYTQKWSELLCDLTDVQRSARGLYELMHYAFLQGKKSRVFFGNCSGREAEDYLPDLRSSV